MCVFVCDGWAGLGCENVISSRTGLRSRTRSKPKPRSESKATDRSVRPTFWADGAADGESFAAAENGDVFPAAGFFWAGEEAPGFAVFFVFRSVRNSRVKVQRTHIGKRFHRHDVPDIFRHHVGSQKVDLLLRILLRSASTFDPVSVALIVRGTFHLHAPELAAHSHQHVVRINIAPRPRHPKIEAASSRHKRSLRRISPPASIRAPDRVELDNPINFFLVEILLHKQKGAARGRAFLPLN